MVLSLKVGKSRNQFWSYLQHVRYFSCFDMKKGIFLVWNKLLQKFTHGLYFKEERVVLIFFSPFTLFLMGLLREIYIPCDLINSFLLTLWVQKTLMLPYSACNCYYWSRMPHFYSRTMNFLNDLKQFQKSLM